MRGLLVGLPILLGMLIAGCNAGRSAGAPVLSTRSDVYGPGDPVSVRLENGTAAEIGYNLCFAFLMLERRSETGWESVEVSLGPDPTAACTLELNGLAPDDQDEGTAHLPADLAAGSYRIATDVEVASARETVATDPFEVRD